MSKQLTKEINLNKLFAAVVRFLLVVTQTALTAQLGRPETE